MLRIDCDPSNRQLPNIGRIIKFRFDKSDANPAETRFLDFVGLLLKHVSTRVFIFSLSLFSRFPFFELSLLIFLFSSFFNFIKYRASIGEGSNRINPIYECGAFLFCNAKVEINFIRKKGAYILFLTFEYINERRDSSCFFNLMQGLKFDQFELFSFASTIRIIVQKLVFNSLTLTRLEIITLSIINQISVENRI